MLMFIQVNLKTSAKMFHWKTREKVRQRKRDRWTFQFRQQEEEDRNNRDLYAVMPSPLGRNWLDYIVHRLKMFTSGIAVYTTAKYTRLNLDLYIETNRTSDTEARKLTNNEPSLVYFGAAETPANSPIGIKKHIRCPGSKKLIRSLKKQRGCVVRKVKEDFTSQTCAKCFGRFDPKTKSHRFKVCQNCRPCHEVMLPTVIVTQKSKRERQFLSDNINSLIAQSVPVPSPQEIGSLLSKVKVYPKKWLVNPVNGHMENVYSEHSNGLDHESGFDEYPIAHKTVWNRDIVAAKCILIKGIF